MVKREHYTNRVLPSPMDFQPFRLDWSRFGPLLADGMHRDPAARPPLHELIRRLQEAVEPIPELDTDDDE